MKGIQPKKRIRPNKKNFPLKSAYCKTEGMKKGSATFDAKRLVRFMSKYKSLSPLLILTHDYPDPDALGSAFALQQIAEKIFGISSKIVYKGEIGRMENKAMVKILKIPARKLKPLDFKKYDHVALVDTQPAFGNNPFPINRQATIVIDQHSSIKKPFSEFSVINTDCGATSVVLAQAVMHVDMKITSSLATALVYGILSDTLNLFRSSNPEVVRTYLKLLPYCDHRALSKIQNPVRSRQTFMTLGKGIQNARVYKRLIVSHLGKIESPDLVSQVADSLIRYKNMSWCLCTGQYKGKLYTSLRMTNQKGDAASILRSIFDNPKHAGGHDTIAGGSLHVGLGAHPDKYRDIQNTWVRRLVKNLKLRGTGEFTRPFQWSQHQND